MDIQLQIKTIFDFLFPQLIIKVSSIVNLPSQWKNSTSTKVFQKELKKTELYLSLHNSIL